MFGNAKTRAAGVLGMMTAASLAAHAGGVNWLNPVDGVWSLGANWDSGVVPVNPDVVSLGLAGDYEVSLVGGRSAGVLSILNTDAILTLQNASSLTLFGDLFNDGMIQINPLGQGSTTTLAFNIDAAIDGGGMIELGSIATRARIVTNNNAVLTHGADHLIHGVGQIDAELINNGTIETSEGELSFRAHDKVNNDQIGAVAPGVLDFSGVTVTQGPGGLIEARGEGAQIELSNATIVGGELLTNTLADVSIDGSSVLDGVLFSGRMNVQNAQVLTIRSSFENNGTIDVNPSGFGSATSMYFADTMTLAGDGVIELSSPNSRARIQTADGAVLTVNPLMTVRGIGRIEADYVNNGLLSSNEGSSIEMISNPKHNNSVMEAIGGSQLIIQGVTVSQGESGVIRALGAPSEIRLVGAEIVGGTLHSDGLGKSLVVSSSVLDGVSHSGELEVSNAQVLTLRDSLINNGVVTVNPMGFGSATSIFAEESMTIFGEGTIVLGAPLTRARIQTGDGAQLTINAGQTIRGLGQIEADLVNAGLISSDVGGEIHFTSDPKINFATMEAVGGSSMRFTGVTVTQWDQGVIRGDGALSMVELVGATLVGGDLVTTGTSVVEARSGSMLDGVDSMALIQIANGNVLHIGTGTLNNGVIEVNPNADGSATSLQFNEDMTLAGTGTIRLMSVLTRARLIGGSSEIELTLGNDQRLEGVGQIGIDLVNHGVIAPGLGGVGEMSVVMPVAFAGDSTFEVEVNAGGGDLLDSNNMIVVGGTLDVSYVDGFAPVGYWARTIMEGSEISGAFSAVNIPAPAFGLVTKVVNTGTELIVGQTCKADQNLDGALDFFDISGFLSAYARMDSSADINGDGSFDFFDISAFLTAFSGGC